ncbi:MAG: tyrosine-type recombinase/integrase [Planctomycetes bacterium]|nr:tyrosine-type recombinase/integrase [Planctomycetota bacterium]
MPAPIKPLTDALPRFLRRCDAESTRVAYNRELRRFLAWMGEQAGPEVLFDYRDHLRQRGLGPTTIQWRTTVARAFLRFAEQQGVVDPRTTGDFRPPKGKSGFAPRILGRSEIRRLLQAPDRRARRGKRDALILVCLGVGGLRAGEVCRLGAEDVQVRSSGPLLHVTGKRRKLRLVALPAEWSALLRSYLRSWPEARGDAPLLWCGQPGHEGDRLTVAAVDYVVRTHAKTAGLSKVSAHALRHTAASLAIDAGEPLHRLRDRLGHSNILVTSRYLHVGSAE